MKFSEFIDAYIHTLPFLFLGLLVFGAPLPGLAEVMVAPFILFFALKIFYWMWMPIRWAMDAKSRYRKREIARLRKKLGYDT